MPASAAATTPESQQQIVRQPKSDHMVGYFTNPARLPRSTPPPRSLRAPSLPGYWKAFSRTARGSIIVRDRASREPPSEDFHRSAHSAHASSRRPGYPRVNVRNFLQLQRAFERNREMNSPPQYKKIRSPNSAWTDLRKSHRAAALLQLRRMCNNCSTNWCGRSIVERSATCPICIAIRTAPSTAP